MEKRQSENNFDLLRLIAAIMVVWSHQFVVLGHPQPEVHLVNGYVGSFGVMIFFGISGYLNTKSLVRRKSATSFLASRATRLYPALVVCVFLTIIMGALITSTPHEYFNVKTLRYLLNSTLFWLEVRLPGVFTENIYPEAVNNSLWTLPMEAACYIGLATIFQVGRFGRYATLAPLLLVAISLLVFSSTVRGLTEDWLVNQDHAPRYYGVGFLSGSLLAAFEGIFNRTTAAIFLCSVATAFVLADQRLTAILLVLPIIFISLGRLPSQRWMRPLVDVSYGTYLYAFPIQQLISNTGLSFWLSFVISLFASLSFGLLSAILVERPALRWLASRQRQMSDRPLSTTSEKPSRAAFS